MARTITLLELRTAVLERGGWSVSADLTTAVLNDVINEAIAELWDTLIQADKDRLATSTNLATAVGNDAVALPADFYELLKLECQDGAEWVPIKPVALKVAHRFTTLTGKHYRRRLQGSNIRLVPTPQAIETLRLWYIPYATKLTADGNTFDGINGYEEHIIQLAKYRCEVRQDLPSQEATYREVGRLLGRVRTASSDRDADEPFYIDPYGPPAEEWDDPWL